MKSRSKCLAEKSIASMLAALETYNKPDFKYREETFSILATNSWELLLKARILQLSGNKLPSIIVYGRRRKRDGSLTSKKYKVTNRSGNYNTIGLFKAFDRLVNDHGDTIEQIVRDNLEALVEVRDNSVHFLNNELQLSKKVHEIGTASIKNYIRLLYNWFGIALSQYDIFMMPIGFIRTMTSASAIVANSEEAKLLQYIHSLEEQFDDDETSEFNFTLNIDVKFHKSSTSPGATNVRITNDDTALSVQLQEQNIRDTHPWDYKILNTRMKKRYSDFKQDKKYHKLRRGLEKDSKFCIERQLDPGNSRSPSKRFYSPNILKAFEEHYTVRTTKSE